MIQTHISPTGTPSGERFVLSAHELEVGSITCPKCEVPAFIGSTEGPDIPRTVICGGCGFVVAASQITNLPSAWLAEADEDDVLEDVRESAISLIGSGDKFAMPIGETLREMVDEGADGNPISINQLRIIAGELDGLRPARLNEADAVRGLIEHLKNRGSR